MYLNYDFTSGIRGCSISVWDSTVTVMDSFEGQHSEYSFIAGKPEIQTYIHSLNSLYWTRKFAELYQVIYEEPAPLDIFDSVNMTNSLSEFIYLADEIQKDMLVSLREEFDKDRTEPLVENDQNLIAVLGQIGAGKTITMQRELIRQNVCETGESVMVCTPIKDTFQFGELTTRTVEYDEITARKETHTDGVSVLETIRGDINLEILASVIIESEYSGWLVLDSLSYNESGLEEFLNRIKRYNHDRDLPVRLMMSFSHQFNRDIYMEFDCLLCHNLSQQSNSVEWLDKSEELGVSERLPTDREIEIDSIISKEDSSEVLVYDIESDSYRIESVQLTPIEYGLFHSRDSISEEGSVGSPIPSEIEDN